MKKASEFLEQLKFVETVKDTMSEIDNLGTFEKVQIVEAVGAIADDPSSIFPMVEVIRRDTEGNEVKSTEVDYSIVFGMNSTKFFNLLVEKGVFSRDFINKLSEAGF